LSGPDAGLYRPPALSDQPANTALNPPAMAISGTTRVFFILGDPVAQVRAPALFNPLFRAHGVDAVLVPAQVAPADVLAFAGQVLRARNIDGLWLTIPHKAALLPLLDHCDALGRAAGAVNAVRRNADGSIEGALFDGLGLAKALDLWGVPLPGQRVLLVGAGGAGMAIAASLAQRGVGALHIFDPQPGRAAAVAQRVATAFAHPAVVAAPRCDAGGFDLVINASPLGLRDDDPLPFDVARLQAGAVVVDILMKPRPTPLQRACAQRSITAWGGLEMMVQQAPDYLAFFGFDDLARQAQAALPALRDTLARSPIPTTNLTQETP